LAASREGKENLVIAGHFGFAALVKSREPTAPLWGLMLASVWLDWVFAPLLALHLEYVEPVHPGYGGLIIHADYTHSILGALLLAAILGLAFLPRWGRWVSVVIALVVMSHWVLDLIVHRPDMPVLPGNVGDLPRFGLGLWTQPGVSAVLELLLVIIGSLMYWRAAKKVSVDAGRSGTWAAVCAGLAAVSGILVLYLDYSG
jgi:membrane-bound metal-dependent hydrolase YbcI (DUF457 family)